MTSKINTQSPFTHYMVRKPKEYCGNCGGRMPDHCSGDKSRCTGDTPVIDLEAKRLQHALEREGFNFETVEPR